MAQTQLILNGTSFPIRKRLLMMACDLFEKQTALLDCPYQVQSRVSTSSFQVFLTSLEEKPITVTKTNYSDLVALSQEFGSSGLKRSLTTFEESQGLCNTTNSAVLSRVCELEAERVSLQRQNAVLQAEVFRLDLRQCELELRLSSLTSRCDALEAALMGQSQSATAAVAVPNPSISPPSATLPSGRGSAVLSPLASPTAIVRPLFDPLKFLLTYQKQFADY
jgi:hypothetical protein